MSFGTMVAHLRPLGQGRYPARCPVRTAAVLACRDLIENHPSPHYVLYYDLQAPRAIYM
jgi:hypothetical protein